MRDLRITYVVFLICAIACKPKTKPGTSEIHGVWRAVANDSIYMEILISPKKIRSMQGHAGNIVIISKMLFAYTMNDLLAEALSSYKLRSDSVIIYQNDMPVAGLRLNKRTQNEILLDQNGISFHLTRVPDDKIMEYVTAIDTLAWDNIYFMKYLEGYYKRKNEYELMLNTSR
jgi:hypothetical protein